MTDDTPNTGRTQLEQIQIQDQAPWAGLTPGQAAIWLTLHCPDEGEALDLLRVAGQAWGCNPKVQAIGLRFLKPHAPRGQEGAA
jgi:hypothetical protein